MNLTHAVIAFRAAVRKQPTRDAAGLALHKAIMKRDAEEVGRLLASPQGAAIVEYRDANGNTPLLNAVEYGLPHIVRRLIAAGADTQAKGWREMTALEVAELDTKITGILAPRLCSRFDEFDRSAFKSFQEIRSMLATPKKGASKISGMTH